MTHCIFCGYFITKVNFDMAVKYSECDAVAVVNVVCCISSAMTKCSTDYCRCNQ